MNRLAQAIDMTAAGTSAPIAIAAKATPTNHEGNDERNSAGTAKFAPILGEAAGIGRIFADASGNGHVTEQCD